MSTQPTAARAAPPPSALHRALGPGIGLLAALHLGLAAWMAIAPRSFFDALGTFGAYNPHYVGDVAAFTGGVGLALAAAVARPALRPGALVAAAAVTGLHAVNHWIDLNAAVGDSSADVFAAVSLTLQLGLTLLLARVAWGRHA